MSDLVLNQLDIMLQSIKFEREYNDLLEQRKLQVRRSLDVALQRLEQANLSVNRTKGKKAARKWRSRITKLVAVQRTLTNRDIQGTKLRKAKQKHLAMELTGA